MGLTTMSDLHIKVTKIRNRWHARLKNKDSVIDEMACTVKQDVGWICREMLRWADKGFHQDQFTHAGRIRHNADSLPLGKIWYQAHLPKGK